MPGYNPVIIPNSSLDQRLEINFSDETSPFTITHTLSKKPDTTILDQDGVELSSNSINVTYLSDTQIQFSWDSGDAISGTILLN